jgi:ABC-type Fe3+/spermidine/putrescine transport system ATPase subunit
MKQNKKVIQTIAKKCKHLHITTISSHISGAAAMASVTLHSISKAYGSAAPVLKDVNFAVSDGEFCVFIGPSGCGKSTLLRSIAGLEDIIAGKLQIGGHDMTHPAPWCSRATPCVRT